VQEPEIAFERRDELFERQLRDVEGDEDPTGPDASTGGLAGLMRRPLFHLYAMQSASTMGVFFAFIASAPHVIVGVLGYPATVYGFGFAAAAASFALGSLVSAKYARRIGLDQMVFGGSLLSLGAAFVMGGLLFSGFWTPWVIFVPAAFAGFGAGVVLPNAQAGAVNANPEGAGVASGVLSFLQLVVGAAVAQVVGASIGDSPYPMAVAMAIMAVLAFLAAAARKIVPDPVG
jgi:DHA1 family bicyclomycin/chloramphenicol resistance-like MFS transporter